MHSDDDSSTDDGTASPSILTRPRAPRPPPPPAAPRPGANLPAPTAPEHPRTSPANETAEGASPGKELAQPGLGLPPLPGADAGSPASHLPLATPPDPPPKKEPAIAPKKTPRKPKGPADPNAPRTVRTSYHFWCEEVRAREGPGRKGKRERPLLEEWKLMTKEQKKPYAELQERDQQRFSAEKRRYKLKQCLTKLLSRSNEH